MASNRFIGFALAVAQVDTRTVGAPSIGSTYTVTCNSKVFTYTAVSATATAEAALLVAAFNLLDPVLYPEFREVTASISSGAIILFTKNAGTEGKPFTFTYGTGGAGSPTFAGSTTTANKGPKVWGTAANWSAGTIPAAGEDLFVDGVFEILYDLDRSGDGTFASFTYEGQQGSLLGLNDVDRDGASYAQYRTKDLILKATTKTIRSGASRIRIDSSTVQTTINSYATGNPEEQAWEAFTWKGTNASNVFNAMGGSIGIAVRDGELATVLTLRTTQTTGFMALRCGPSVTLGTLTMTDGTVTIPPCTTVTQAAGTLTIVGAATVTTLTIDGGTCNFLTQGTITTLSLSGTLNLDGDVRPVTITNGTIYKGYNFTDHAKRTTFTNTLTRKCGVQDGTFIHGASGTLLSA